jgi:cytoskeleton protein RodZ
MSKLADTLYAARRQSGLSLEEVAHSTRIPVATLQAIENDDIRRLPSTVYARGFVRNYAAFLNLDPDQMARLFDEAINYRPQTVKITAREPVRIAGLVTPNVAAIGVAVVLASIVFVWLYSAFFVADPTRTARLPTPPVPTPTALAAVVLPISTSTPPPRPTEAVLPAATATAERVPTTAASVPGLTPAAIATPTAGPPGAAATPTADPGSLALKVRIIEAPSWVQVRTDGVVVFSGTLAPGVERSFSAKSELFIHAGRSDAVELVLNGVPQGRLGSPGQAVVRRTFTRSGAADAPPSTSA